MRRRHILHNPLILLDGRRVSGLVRCAPNGRLPLCKTEQDTYESARCLEARAREHLIIELDELPEIGGLHFIQAQNRGGLISDDAFSLHHGGVIPERSGDLLRHGPLISDLSDWTVTQTVGRAYVVRHRDDMGDEEQDINPDREPALRVLRSRSIDRHLTPGQIAPPTVRRPLISYLS